MDIQEIRQGLAGLTGIERERAKRRLAGIPDEPEPVVTTAPKAVSTAEPAKSVRRYRLPASCGAVRKIRISDEIWACWCEEAAAMELPVSIWLRLKIDGFGDKPMAAPVEEAKPLVRDQILAGMGQALKKREIPALARKLGVPARSVHASLGSMVASKVLVRAGDEYRRV